jgi:hypothetical protein
MEEALQELIALFLKINPRPSDQQFHALAEAVGVDKETLEACAYAALADAEDLLQDPEEASSTHEGNDDPLTRSETSIYSTSPSTSLSYGDDDEEGGDTHFDNETIAMIRRINASARLRAGEEPPVLDDPALDPDDLSLTDVAMNDGDPTDDDLGLQDETVDDGYTEDDVGVGLTNNANDVLTDDGVPDISLP